MQLDQARQKKVAGQILPLFRSRSFADLDDEPVHHGDPAGLDHAIGKNDTGIRQDHTGGTHDIPWASEVKRVTSMTVSAIAVRTSSS